MDALFFGAHPDDVELTSGGFAARLAAHGHSVGIVDLTRGEAGTRGTVEEREQESQEAGRILGVARRWTLGLPDMGIDAHDRAQLTSVVECLRAERPRLVVAPDRHDPHPDHVEASVLITRACHLAGFARFPAGGERFRPARLLYALFFTDPTPHLVVDISSTWERRHQALLAHRSQLGPAPGPSTYLTEPDFLAEVEARARAFGSRVGVRHGEGYRTRGPIGITDARALLTPAGGEE
jgi:bacillithiol biosynthesis deacetylase BshB1